MSFGPGSRLDAYEIVRPLGSGGMGEVWLATEVRLGRKVALKVLPPDLTQDPLRVQRFEQEARAASALNHPNVCTIHALGQTSDGQHYIAMEYVEGETLRHRLSTTRPSVRESLDIAVQVAAALSAAHESGIVHRDIKPENVMLRPDGFVKVLDFGLAKLAPAAPVLGAADVTHTALKTDAGIVVGTVAYMSPEQARGQGVDARTDIWSLGVILYEMVAGRSPFVAPSGTEVLAAILDRDPAPLMQFEPHTPGELQRVVSKALRKDRERRYQFMKELRLDLESLREEAFPRQHASSGDAVVPSSGSTPSMQQPGSLRGVVPRRSHRALVGAGIVLGGAILAAGVGFWFTHRVQEPLATPAPTVTRLTANPADVSVSSARISPDGKYVAYSDPTGVQVRVIDSGETQRLSDTQGMAVYAWTADGTKIRAARCDQNTCTGWDVSILGGSRQPSGATWPANVQVRATPDGSRLLTIAEFGEVKVNLLDGEPPKILVRTERFSTPAAWSADASHVYFVRSQGVIESVSVNGGSPTSVFSGDKGTQVTDIGPALPDGRIFAVLKKAPQASQRLAARAVVEIHTAASDVPRTRALTDWEADQIGEISASNDGSRLTFLRGTFQADVYLSDFDARRTAVTTPKRLTLDERDDDATAWTPDSTRVIFSSDRNGARDLFKQRLDSDVAEPFVVAPGAQTLARVTSDGQWVLYTDEQPDKPTRIMRVPLVGGRPETLVTYPSGAGGFCHCSFHGRCVLLQYSPPGGSPAVVFALDPIRGKQQELTRFPSTSRGANLTPDGEHFAYIVPEETGIQNHVRILSFRGEPSHDIVVKNAVRLGTLDSFPTGGFLSQEMAFPRQTLFFIAAEGNASVIWRPEQLGVGTTLVSPDGKHLAINALTNQGNVWLIDQR